MIGFSTYNVAYQIRRPLLKYFWRYLAHKIVKIFFQREMIQKRAINWTEKTQVICILFFVGFSFFTGQDQYFEGVCWVVFLVFVVVFRRSPGSNLRPLVYKVSGLSTAFFFMTSLLAVSTGS